MNHKCYPLAYLLEVVMPLNLVTIRDEELQEKMHNNGIKADWVMAFDAGNGKTVTLNYYRQCKNPFGFQWKGFDRHPYYLDNEQRMIPVKSINFWGAIQILRTLDSLTHKKATGLV